MPLKETYTAFPKSSIYLNDRVRGREIHSIFLTQEERGVFHRASGVILKIGTTAPITHSPSIDDDREIKYVWLRAMLALHLLLAESSRNRSPNVLTGSFACRNGARTAECVRCLENDHKQPEFVRNGRSEAAVFITITLP